MIGKKKLILIIARRTAIALVFILIAIFSASFFKGKITKIGDALIENKKSSVVLQKRSEMLQQIEKDIAIVNGNDEKINQAYVSVDNILDFVTVIENLAAQNSSQYKVTFGNPVIFMTKSDGSNIYEIDYTLTMSGTVYTITSFLKQFNNLPFYADINSVVIRGTAEKGWEGEASITIQGKVYAR